MINKDKLFKILVVDDEQGYRDTIKLILTSNGYTVKTVTSGEEALQALKKENFHLVLTDYIMSGISGIELLEIIKESYPEIEVIVFTGNASIDNAITAIKKGASSYFIKGHDPEELLLNIEKIQEIHSLKYKDEVSKLDYTREFMLTTKNPRFQRTLDIAKKAAESNSNILILGESGVGKEVLAKYIHQNSPRFDQAFTAVNCHAFTGTLLESELFGHEKGAFTGALSRRIGRFEAANNGTLMLDEIGDTLLDTQVKLLRTIENKTIERIGSNQLIEVDFRLISATNKNLYQMIASGDFREDLFYRISTITIDMPPLRERKEDLKDLIEFFLQKFSRELNKEIKKIDIKVTKYLLNYNYPGNIRELKNIIERMVVLSTNGVISDKDLPDMGRFRVTYDDQREENQSLKAVRHKAESEHIANVLREHNYNMKETAKSLGISRRQLFNKMNEYNLR